MVGLVGNIRQPSSRTRIYTLEEYLQREERAFHKHEFYDGIIIKMAGAKAKHNQIAAQIAGALIVAVRGLQKRYRVYNSDQKIHIEAANSTVYPDALVICEQPEFWNGREDIITNPLIVVEVLSRSTSSYDMGEKFVLYQKLPSLEEYVTIEQHMPCVESWYKIAENTWQKTTVTDPTQAFQIRSLGVQLRSDEVYENIEF